MMKLEKCIINFHKNIIEPEEYVELELSKKLQEKELWQYATDIVDQTALLTSLRREKKKSFPKMTYWGWYTFFAYVIFCLIYGIYVHAFGETNWLMGILLIICVSQLFQREYHVWFMKNLLSWKRKYAKKKRVEKVIFHSEGMKCISEESEKFYTWNEISCVVESEYILNIHGKLVLMKEGNLPENVEHAQKYLKEHLGEKYIVHRSALKPGWWRMALFVFLLILVILEIILSGNGTTFAERVDEQWKEENIYSEYSGYEEIYTYEEPVKVGTISIRDGVFMEKVADKSKLLLDKQYINWNDIYYTNMANENTHLQIRSGVLYAESYNGSGQLGLGHKEPYYNAKGFCPAYEIDSEVLSCGIGETFIAYIKQNGNLYAIGEIKGQTEMPSATILMTDVVFMDCGQDYILAMKKDGSVWILGQQGKEADRENPAAVYTEFTKIFDKAIFISAGRYTSAVILDDNSLWLWGDNAYGQCAREASDEFILAENAVRVPGEYKWVWNDLPEFDSPHVYIAEPNLDQNRIVLNNYRTYMQKVDGSLVVCGKDVTEAVLMPLEVY